VKNLTMKARFKKLIVELRDGEMTGDVCQPRSPKNQCIPRSAEQIDINAIF